MNCTSSFVGKYRCKKSYIFIFCFNCYYDDNDKVIEMLNVIERERERESKSKLYKIGRSQ